MNSVIRLTGYSSLPAQRAGNMALPLTVAIGSPGA